VSTSTTTASLIVSNYSSALTDNSEIDSQTGQYSEIIEIRVNTAEIYTFKSSSRFDSYTCLYRNYFTSSNSSPYRMRCDHDSAGNRQLKFSAYLQFGIPYTLIFTTYRPAIRGPFTIVATGPDQIDFNPTDSVRPTMPTTTSK
jgi:hypothetical protein